MQAELVECIRPENMVDVLYRGAEPTIVVVASNPARNVYNGGTRNGKRGGTWYDH